jgi:hypothetical protein
MHCNLQLTLVTLDTASDAMMLTEINATERVQNYRKTLFLFSEPFRDFPSCLLLCPALIHLFASIISLCQHDEERKKNLPRRRLHICVNMCEKRESYCCHSQNRTVAAAAAAAAH